MALTSRIPITMLDAFPHGAYLVSQVEPVRDFDKSSTGMAVQATDKETGELEWSVTVLDADPDARPATKTCKVKLTAKYQPVPPAATPGSPFTAVEFDGLTVTPYVQEGGGRPRVAYSFRASEMRAPAVGGKSTSFPSDKAA
jgi:hypothetical protein